HLSPNRQAATFCCRLVLRCTPSTYCAPAYTVGSNSAPLSRRKVDSATCNTFQINAVAFSTFLKRLAAVVRNRTVANGDSTTLLVRKCGQCSRGNWEKGKVGARRVAYPGERPIRPWGRAVLAWGRWYVSSLPLPNPPCKFSLQRALQKSAFRARCYHRVCHPPSISARHLTARPRFLGLD